MIAGTLALSAMARADLRAELSAFAGAHAADVASSAWHAAQVVAALGEVAPRSLWEACVRDLDVRPWAPWTALAARARGDRAVLARALSTVAASIRDAAPHVGGCDSRPVPETALTALCVEALAPEPRARAAVRRARAFLRARQMTIESMSAAILPDVALGGFAASPVAEMLRVDITAHAALALREKPQR
jgi:hypothetical protein